MILPLARTQFLDELWGEAELDDAAEFWLKTYESLLGESGLPRDPDCSLRLVIRCVPRSAAEGLIAELQARTSAHVSRLAFDTIAIDHASLDVSESPPRGLGLATVLEAIDGYPVEVRFTIAGRAGKFIGRTRFSSTLVLHGEAKPDGLLVKALWRTGREGWEDEAFRYQRVPDAVRLEQAIAEHRQAGAIPGKRLARKLFSLGDLDMTAAWLQRAVVVPFTKFRLPGLAKRVVIHALVLAVGSLLVDRLLKGPVPIALLPVIVVFFPIAIAIGYFWLHEVLTWVRGGRYLRTLFARHYAENRLTPLDADDLLVLNDPDVRRLAADLLGHGFTHLGDRVSLLNDGERSLLRMFVDPDRLSLVTLNFVRTQDYAGTPLRFWPFAIGVQVHTFFDGGGFLQTASANYAYHRRRTSHDSRIRFLKFKYDVIAFHRSHLEALSADLAVQAKAVRPVGTHLENLRLLEEIREEERLRFQETGIGFVDHMRWHLQWPRTEIRG